ncbi:hypothetical protein, partial [Sphaerospermopsis sp. LEGE 08334]|uniref:hypothetical protein n=1 Tax=Sphaerospermopsis sp. LEGE 08334 TaxID=1828651 RepID=UPI0018822565
LAINGYSLANKANDKADIAINRIDGLKKEVDNIVAGALSAMQRLENEIKFITEAARQAMLRLQSRIENLENYTGELSKIVGNLWSEISGLNARVSELTAFINSQISGLQKTVNQELAKLQKQIPEILGKIALFTAQIAGILVTIAGIQLVLKRLNPLTVINNFITNNNVVNNTNNNVVNNQNTTVVNNQVDNALLRKIDQTTTTNLGVSTSLYALGKVMDEKLGPAIMRGGSIIGLSGKLIQGFNWLVIDRALNVMTFGVTVHNAAMLSTNIVQTLTQAIQNVVDLVGLKDDNGNEFQVGEAINSAISNAVKSIVGKNNYDYWIKQWNYYNRIYQAGANLFSSLLSMGDTMVNALNTISGQNAKIANALKIWGVVGEKAYGWMNITPNFNNPLITKLNNFEETASMVEQVTQEPLNIKSAKEGLEQATKDTYDAIEQKPGTESKQGKEVPEAIKVKADEDKKTTESKGIAKLLEDAYPDDDE